MKFALPLVATAAAVLVLTGCATGGKPSMAIEEIMESGFKGKESLCARLTQGQTSQEENLRMVQLTRELSLNKPPKGDLASWTAKTTALHAAAQDVAARKPGAVDAFKSAVNCKACHSVHKPD
ncbi:MAG: hypothetical protein ACKOET_20440 [Verrucomicrobiota bacterium]